MPLFYQHNINKYTRLGVWKIEEPEAFFAVKVPLQREITHPHKRLQHLAGRYLLQLLFADFPYEEIVIADTKKPYLPYDQYHFSISHCGNFAAAIVSSNERVGIDIEIPSPKIQKISHKFLHASELDFAITAGNANQQPASILQLLTVMWGAKEAVFKWWGWGSVDFSEHIILQPFSFSNAGHLQASFTREQEIVPLGLQYILFDELCLVWVVS